MRAPVGLLLLFATTIVVAREAPVTLESRSQRYGLVVEVQKDDRYSVRVIDLQSKETILARDFSALPAEASADLRDLRAAVRLSEAPYGITAAAEIEQGDMLVDSLHATWTLTPHRARLRAPGALRVGPDVKAPVLVHRVEPVYTDEARRARVAGVVIVEAVVGKTGAVKDAMVLKPLPFGLSEAALAAVKQWKFQPATLHGEPVDVIFNVTVSFQPSS